MSSRRRGQVQQAVPAVRRLPGVRVGQRPSAPAGSSSPSSQGPNGHPALRNKLVRRALAYGIDRAVHRPTDAAATSIPRLAALDSVVSPGAEPLLRAELERVSPPAGAARRLLERAGCRRGADGIFACDGNRLSLRFVTTAGRTATSAGGQAGAGSASGSWGRGRPGFAPAGPFFTQILPQGLFDVALFSWFSEPGDLAGRASSAARSAELDRLLPATRDRPPRPGRRTLDEGARARVLNRADRGLASDVPIIPLYQSIFTAAYDTSVRDFVFLPWNWFWNAENWWLAE